MDGFLLKYSNHLINGRIDRKFGIYEEYLLLAYSLLKHPSIPQSLPKWEGVSDSLLSPVGERRVGEKRGLCQLVAEGQIGDARHLYRARHFLVRSVLTPEIR